MRWAKQVALKSGEMRTIRNKFLFFPKIINHQYRWLEYASWEDVSLKVDNRDFFGYRIIWVPSQWIDK